MPAQQRHTAQRNFVSKWVRRCSVTAGGVKGVIKAAIKVAIPYESGLVPEGRSGVALTQSSSSSRGNQGLLSQALKAFKQAWVAPQAHDPRKHAPNSLNPDTRLHCNYWKSAALVAVLMQAPQNLNP